MMLIGERSSPSGTAALRAALTSGISGLKPRARYAAGRRDEVVLAVAPAYPAFPGGEAEL
jgi:hypothetical protein